MPSEIKFSKIIAGKEVDIVFIFNNYKPHHLNADFNEFVGYQTKAQKGLTKEELDFRFLGVKNWASISYEDFLNFSTKFLSKAIFSIISQNRYLIVGEKLVIEFKVIRVKNRDYYYEYKLAEKKYDEGSDIEHALFDISGIWLLQAIVANWVYLQRIDYTYIFRYFLHELTHHYDYSTKQLAIIESDIHASEQATTQRTGTKFLNDRQPLIIKYVKFSTAPAMRFLFESIFNLRDEGLADFNARRAFSRLDISTKGIMTYNNNLLQLALQPTVNSAEKFYNEKIGYGNLTPAGEYANGRMMCLFVALALAREKRVKYTIKFGGESITTHNPDWKQLLKMYSNIYVLDLPVEIIDLTLSQIMATTPETFIGLYGEACSVLGITSDSNKVMTYKRMSGLRELAITNYRKQRAKVRVSRGFV